MSKGLAIGVCALGLLGACMAAAAEPGGHSPQLDRCLENVIDNEHSSRWPGVVICYENELDAMDRRLDGLYRTLEAAAPRLGPRGLDQITSSRRQWTAYRDAWCAFEQDHAIAPNADIARLSCRIDLAKSQLGRVTEMAAPPR